ncbi:MAG: hypothetical protein ACR2H2_08315 [Solirubrobacteraceae bacterium]
MTADLLLHWASERGEGSWQQLRDAHEWIATAYPLSSASWRPTPGMTARRLTTLGHVEIDWQHGRWAVAPPLLTILPSAGAHALLTGARTRALINQLTDAADDPSLFVTTCPQRHAPTAILIACEDETHIESLAEELGIGYEFSVSDRLSELLPTLDSYLALASTTPAPRGYGVAQLDLQSLRWDDAESDREPGLYRYDQHGRPAYRLVSEQQTYDVDWGIGAWAALSRWGENKLQYRKDAVNGTLVAPIGAPLPTLHARAAALCSGLAPARSSGADWYRNVPRHVAERIARSLDQTLVTP